MMDDALLRPGRLEVQIEIGLPKVRGPSFTSLLISHFYKKQFLFTKNSTLYQKINWSQG